MMTHYTINKSCSPSLLTFVDVSVNSYLVIFLFAWIIFHLKEHMINSHKLFSIDNKFFSMLLLQKTILI